MWPFDNKNQEPIKKEPKLKEGERVLYERFGLKMRGTLGCYYGDGDYFISFDLGHHGRVNKRYIKKNQDGVTDEKKLKGAYDCNGIKLQIGQRVMNLSFNGYIEQNATGTIFEVCENGARAQYDSIDMIGHYVTNREGDNAKKWHQYGSLLLVITNPALKG